MSTGADIQRERHPYLYFEDGDIILAAHASPSLIQTFCVHRALLAHYSEVFRDMFVVGAASSKPDTIPEVRLPSDDCASDVATFLDVVYNALYAPYILLATALCSRARSQEFPS